MKKQYSQSQVPLSNEVFVGNLSFFCREQDLFSLFQDYCTVREVRIMRSENSARTLMYGFVTLASVFEAREMAKLLNNHLFMGRRLKVETSDRKTGHAASAMHQHQQRSQQVHVSFSTAFSSQLADVKPTEVLLRKYFMPFGSLLDVAVKEYHISTDGRQQDGYAFLTFESAVSASAVVKQGLFLLEGLELRCTAPLPPAHVRHTQSYPARSQDLPRSATKNFLRVPGSGHIDTRSISPPQREERALSALINTPWLSPEVSLSAMDTLESERESPLHQWRTPNHLPGDFPASILALDEFNNNSNNNNININSNSDSRHRNNICDGAPQHNLSLLFPHSFYPLHSQSLSQSASDPSPSSSASSSGHCSVCAEGPVGSAYCPATSLSL